MPPHQTSPRGLLLSALIWVYLLAFRGGFWRATERLAVPAATLDHWPSVTAVIPARDEAGIIAESLTSLLE